MPDVHDDPLEPMGRGPHEIIHNMNTGRYELRSYGSDEAIISGDTASEIAQVAEASSLNVRMVAGRPVMMNEDSIIVAREVDLAARGITPPPTAPSTNDPGLHVELDRLAADLDAAAIVDETPTPDLPSAESLRADKLREANEQWLAAYDAQQKLLSEMGEAMEEGAAFGEFVQQLRVVNEAVTAAEARLADLGDEFGLEVQAHTDNIDGLTYGPDEQVAAHAEAEAADRLRNEPDDPPEVELVDKPGPKPSSGPTAEALDEPVLDHSEPAIPMPTEHITTGTDRAQELREEAQTRYENRIANGMTPQDAANYDLALQAAMDRPSMHMPGTAMWNHDVQYHTRVNLRIMAQHQDAALDVKEAASRTLEPVRGVEKKARLGKVLKRPH